MDWYQRRWGWGLKTWVSTCDQKLLGLWKGGAGVTVWSGLAQEQGHEEHGRYLCGSPRGYGKGRTRVRLLGILL